MSKRRSMADDDAAAFVFGQDSDRTPESSPTPEPKTEPKASTPKQTTKKNRAIDQLMKAAEQERQVRITVDLAASQHQALTLASAKLSKSKAEIIRALVDDFLSELND